jgi:hypothetical protein
MSASRLGAPDHGHDLHCANTLESHGWPVASPTAQYLLPLVGHVIVAHAVSGEQVALQLHELVQDRLPHAPVPVQLSVHLPAPHIIVPHAGAPPEQLALHAPVVQVMFPHALMPVQVASQVPVEHDRSPHAWSAVQRIVQLAASPHVIAPHAPDELQVTTQFHPAGHDTGAPPAPSIMHVAGVAPNTHPPVHRLGHTGASGAASSLAVGSTTQ